MVDLFCQNSQFLYILAHMILFKFHQHVVKILIKYYMPALVMVTESVRWESYFLQLLIVSSNSSVPPLKMNILEVSSSSLHYLITCFGPHAGEI